MNRHSVSNKIRRFSERILDKFFPAYLGDNYLCPVCGTGLSHFSPLSTYFLRELDRNQFIHSIFQTETLNLENYACPSCGASDRDRLYALYLREGIDPIRHYRILDFAPSLSLQRFIKTFGNIEYRSADLLVEDVDDVVDITDMKIYPDASFDVFICSHVLEHVPDDRKAMAELHRILSVGGWGIVMVPINLAVEKTHEDPTIIDPASRWKYFGQDDHVRLYSKRDFIERLGRAGFTVDQLGIDHFGVERFYLYGVHPRSVLYVVRK